jgi:hypothetical protein
MMLYTFVVFPFGSVPVRTYSAQCFKLHCEDDWVATSTLISQTRDCGHTYDVDLTIWSDKPCNILHCKVLSWKLAAHPLKAPIFRSDDQGLSCRAVEQGAWCRRSRVVILSLIHLCFYPCSRNTICWYARKVTYKSAHTQRVRRC